MASPDWVIYTRKEPHCVWCERTKILLKGQKIAYEERDIGIRNHLDEFLDGYGFRTVPQVIHKGTIIGGYEKTKEYILGHTAVPSLET